MNKISVWIIVILTIQMGIAQDGPWSEPVLVDSINGVIDDFYPSISADGQTMYFTTGNNIMVSHWNGTSWGTPEMLGDNVNGGQRQVKATVTPDNRTLYFTSWRAGGYGTYDIWKSEWDDSSESWGEPEVLPPQINTMYMEWDVQLSYDGRKMYFSSDRIQGWGYEDIWCSEWDDSTESWGEPVSLGTTINSSLPDYSPYPSSDGMKLYFCSWSRHGFLPPEWQEPPELFVAYNNNGVWDSLEILTSLNSDYWEESPAISADGNTLYFASTRPGGPGPTDVYVSHRITEIVEGLEIRDLNFNIFPNPGNSTITFSLKIPGNEHDLSFKIYNVLGQKVNELNFSYAGIFSWNCKNSMEEEIPAGCYFAVCKTKDFSLTKKFTVLK